MGTEKFGARLRDARSARRLSQHALAMKTGFHAQTISEWERSSEGLPRTECIRTLAGALEVEFMWLAFGDGAYPFVRSESDASTLGGVE